MNTVIIQGNVTRDGEVRTFPNGQVTAFGVAVNKSYKDQNGDWQEKVTFIDCKYFGKQTVEKGDAVLITGELDVESWEKDGQKRSKTLVKVDKIKRFTGYKKNGPSQNTDNQVEAEVAVGAGADIPF